MKCGRCNGEGKIPNYFAALGGETCEKCGGTGRVGGKPGAGDVYLTAMDYSKNVQQLIALGDYTHCDPVFLSSRLEDQSRCGSALNTTVKIRYECFNDAPIRIRTTANIGKLIRELGYRNANLLELLTFAYAFPKAIQRHEYVIALGSPFVYGGLTGQFVIPILSNPNGKIRLDCVMADPAALSEKRWGFGFHFMMGLTQIDF